MAMTVAGFQGTVSDTQWARIMAGVGQKYTLISGDDVYASGRVAVIPRRSSVGAGVLCEETANVNVTIPAPSTGQWHLIVLRRNWASRNASFTSIPGATTANTEQSAPPSVLPAGRVKTPGISDDEPVAWVHARAGSTSLQIWQLGARAGGAVPGKWALWDATEQGFSFAYCEAERSRYVRIGSRLVLDSGTTIAKFRSGNISGSSAFTVLANAGMWDVGEHPLAPWANGLVAPVDGDYVVSLNLSAGAAAGLQMMVGIKKNSISADTTGLVAGRAGSVSSGTPRASVTAVLRLSAGDSLVPVIWVSNAGGPWPIAADPTSFSMSLQRAL